MINELKVFYAGDKGLMTFSNKKTIFQHREEREGVKEGLGIIVENGLFDKGNYAFAVFKSGATSISVTEIKPLNPGFLSFKRRIISLTSF